jgi:hypothetical protein
MAAPAVSGAAAILRYHFPDYSARQIAAQLKVTTDNIDTIAGNAAFAGLLGTGRLNMYRALTEIHHTYILMLDHLNHSDGFGHYQGGQTIFLASRFENLLAPSPSVLARLTSLSEWVTVVNPELDLGSFDSGQIVSNETEPFMLEISSGIPPNQEVSFLIEFFDSEGNYAGRQVFGMLLNIDFVNLAVNKISTTITSYGTIGFNYPNYRQGLGFSFRNGRNMIRAAGLMAGINTNKVVDNLYGPTSGSFNQFLVPVKTASIDQAPIMADVEVFGSFNDAAAGLSKIGIKTLYRVSAWEFSPYDKFIILEYQLINTTTQAFNGLYAGFFADWVIADAKNHRAAFDATNRMGYAYSLEGGHYSGISLLTEGEMRHYAFDNNGASGSINISDGFTNFEKYNALRTNRQSAGVFDTTNDISTLVSSGPHYLAAADTLVVAFAFLAGDHLIGLKASAANAYNRYHGIEPVGVNQITSPEREKEIRKVFPNPFSEFLYVELLPKQTATYQLKLIDMKGRAIVIKSLSAEAGQLTGVTLHLPKLKPGQYILQLENEYGFESIRVLNQK